MPQQRSLNDDNEDALTTITVDSDDPNNTNTDEEQQHPTLALHHQPKQGGKYFGCCCDYRRAVVIVGTVTVCMALMEVIFLLGRIDTYTPSFDDDELNSELLDLNETYRIPYLLMESMAIVFGSVSVMAALTFNRFGTVVALLYAIVSTTFVILIDIDGRQSANEILNDYDKGNLPVPYFYYSFLGLVAVLWWYPSICFLWEVHRGIMSLRTYPREEYSCCCHSSSLSSQQRRVS